MDDNGNADEEEKTQETEEVGVGQGVTNLVLWKLDVAPDSQPATTHNALSPVIAHPFMTTCGDSRLKGTNTDMRRFQQERGEARRWATCEYNRKMSLRDSLERCQ
ncbi:hypothetical protein E2C01_006749 [Portunus trituberculatus]|uniref:Uncharacterized protein n=1 Tax=Portunus trituberculatus TaxID=210409 RepID=A0A5B7D0H7_PORTR|nr:hypothetical protein [Portunus trituberculatus]